MVLCGVGGVQSQSITVDKQMKRYNIPRLAFINKLDRQGSDPLAVLQAMRSKLRLNAALMQVPIGLQENHKGIVDLVTKKAYINTGDYGETITEIDIPADLVTEVESKRTELIERLAEVDNKIEELYLSEKEPSDEELMQAVRRATLSLSFVPVFMGSAYKNKGVQHLLDAVGSFLPSPLDAKYSYLDQNNNETEVEMQPLDELPLVALAFKLGISLLICIFRARSIWPTDLLTDIPR